MLVSEPCAQNRNKQIELPPQLRASASRGSAAAGSGNMYEAKATNSRFRPPSWHTVLCPQHKTTLPHLGQQPAPRSSCAILPWPFCAASVKAMRPSAAARVASAPASSRARTTSLAPLVGTLEESCRAFGHCLVHGRQFRAHFCLVARLAATVSAVSPSPIAPPGTWEQLLVASLCCTQ